MNSSPDHRRPIAALLLRGVLLCAALAAAGAHAAAVGTAANTSISNTVTFSYSYTGTSGAVATSTTANTSFVVDRKVDLTLTDANSAYNSAQTLTPGPGTTNAVLRFTLTNTSNATLDFQVIGIDSTDPYGGTDSYDQTATVFVDVNGDGTYTAATDTATFVDELTSGTSIAVFIVGNIPSGAIDGDISAKLLTATARAGGGAASLGAALTATVGAETSGSMDTLFADAAGTGDAARDAALGVRDAFKVTSTVPGVSKSVSVLNDPSNGVTNPKAIPGATLQYTIVVNNPPAAPATAQAVTITDALPAGVTYVSPSITVNAGATGTDANDGVDASGFDVRQSGGTVTVLLGDMAANTTRTIRFQVTVDASQAPNTSISNTASAAYSVGGVAQTPKTSTADFLVDRDLNLTLVDHNAGYNSAQTLTPAPGSSDAVLRYTLTNTGNGTQDFSFADANSTDPYGGTDNHNQISNVFVDTNGDGTYVAATDTATFVDELAANGTIAVFVVGGSVLPARADADISAKLLTATIRAGGAAASQGAVLTAPNVADTATLVDNVFSDAAGFSDAAREGTLNTRDAFKVFAPQLTLAKSSTVESDPINGTDAGRKRIPGAVVRYTLVLTNTGGAGAAAQSTVVTDAIPANTTFVSGSITYQAATRTNAADGDNCDWNVTTVGAVTCTPGNLAQGQSRTITFDVTVD